MKTSQVVFGAIKGLAGAIGDEYRRGTLGETLKKSRAHKTLAFADDMSQAQLLEEKAGLFPERPYLRFKGQVFTYGKMDENANRAANFLLSLGGGPGKSAAIMMKNSPRWLDIFFGAQRTGMAAVPVNVALRGAQLAHILNNSDAHVLAIDHDLYPYYEKIKGELDAPPTVIIETNSAGDDYSLPEGAHSVDEIYGPNSSAKRPDVSPRDGDVCLLMYTSGTTGMPKGVVTRYGKTGVKTIALMSRLMLKPEDVYFTCFPLFHANALLLTVTNAMHAGAQVALSEKFSASRFWDEVYESGGTVFNGLGAMMPILMKQPVKEVEKKHKVTRVLSAACPADMWEPFEKRFGVEIIEGYGAVDGGGLIIMNWGQAPKGSLGKPIGSKIRIVDEDMNDVPQGEPGELIAWVGDREIKVEYYKNEAATSDKIRDGWLHTGDLVYADEKGFLYFAGRKSESMRRRGENISAYEVEHAILQHPDVLECAVFAVPSELAEDDVMAAIVPVEGKEVDPNELAGFLSDQIARFAVPRYYRIMKELPKTETHRVIKSVLGKEGVTEDTVDLEPGGKRS